MSIGFPNSCWQHFNLINRKLDCLHDLLSRFHINLIQFVMGGVWCINRYDNYYNKTNHRFVEFIELLYEINIWYFYSILTIANVNSVNLQPSPQYTNEKINHTVPISTRFNFTLLLLVYRDINHFEFVSCITFNISKKVLHITDIA